MQLASVAHAADPPNAAPASNPVGQRRCRAGLILDSGREALILPACADLLPDHGFPLIGTLTAAAPVLLRAGRRALAKPAAAGNSTGPWPTHSKAHGWGVTLPWPVARHGLSSSGWCSCMPGAGSTRPACGGSSLAMAPATPLRRASGVARHWPRRHPVQPCARLWRRQTWPWWCWHNPRFKLRFKPPRGSRLFAQTCGLQAEVPSVPRSPAAPLTSADAWPGCDP